jgi:hypothetical protein
MIQVVAGALLLGVLILSGVIFVALVDLNDLNPAVKMLTLIGAVAGVSLYCVSLVLPKLFSAAVNKSGSDSETVQRNAVTSIMRSLTTENIARLALIEGGVFLNAVVMILEPHKVTIGILIAGIVLMLLLFPRRGKLISTLEDRLSEIDLT